MKKNSNKKYRKVSPREYCELTGWEPGVSYYDEKNGEWYTYIED